MWKRSISNYPSCFSPSNTNYTEIVITESNAAYSGQRGDYHIHVYFESRHIYISDTFCYLVTVEYFIIYILLTNDLMISYIVLYMHELYCSALWPVTPKNVNFDICRRSIALIPLHKYWPIHRICVWIIHNQIRQITMIRDIGHSPCWSNTMYLIRCLCYWHHFNTIVGKINEYTPQPFAVCNYEACSNASAVINSRNVYFLRTHTLSRKRVLFPWGHSLLV